MNKKFSTLVAGLALCTAFTANAKVENGKVYQLTNEDGKYLSVTESYTKTDSLILADAPTADIKNTDYQKSLWKVTYRFVSLANTWAYTLTNSATGRVLTLDKQAEWNFKNEGAFIAPENVTAVLYLLSWIIRQLFLSSLKMMWKLKEQILLLWKRERLYLHLRLTLQ